MHYQIRYRKIHTLGHYHEYFHHVIPDDVKDGYSETASMRSRRVSIPLVKVMRRYSQGQQQGNQLFFKDKKSDIVGVLNKFNTSAKPSFQDFAGKLSPAYSENEVEIETSDNSNHTTPLSSPSSMCALTAHLSQDSLNKCGVNGQKVVAI